MSWERDRVLGLGAFVVLVLVLGMISWGIVGGLAWLVSALLDAVA